MGRMALAAEQGGAQEFGPAQRNIREIQKNVDLPVIGIVKRSIRTTIFTLRPLFVKLTSWSKQAVKLSRRIRDGQTQAGRSDTRRVYEQLRDRFPGQKFMADCSTVEEALHADKLGFDYIGTGLYIFCRRTLRSCRPLSRIRFSPRSSRISCR